MAKFLHLIWHYKDVSLQNRLEKHRSTEAQSAYRVEHKVDIRGVSVLPFPKGNVLFPTSERKWRSWSSSIQAQTGKRMHCKNGKSFLVHKDPREMILGLVWRNHVAIGQEYQHPSEIFLVSSKGLCITWWTSTISFWLDSSSCHSSANQFHNKFTDRIRGSFIRQRKESSFTILCTHFKCLVCI